jgi:formate hydrogenlyase subunit 3/multisubunit Na+/H+ antiporter MnhD subunit
MLMLITALSLFAAGAVVSGFIALNVRSEAGSRAANIIGPAFAAAACAAGLLSLFSGGWGSAENVIFDWWLPIGSLALGLDPLTRLFLVPVFVLGMVCAVSGGLSLRGSVQNHDLGAHWMFYLILLLGMTCVMAARDGLFFMMSWELMSLSPFFLIEFNDRDRKVQNASWVYLVAAHLGAVLLTAFFALAWAESGTTLFSGADRIAAGHSSLLFILALLGFGAKAGLAPMHVWLPEAHPAAPSHVSALLSGAMLNAGLYGILRSFQFLGPVEGFPLWWAWLIMFMGAATAFTGIFKALAQSNLKRLLAYSSVENMGLMILAAGAGLVGVLSGNAWIAALGFSGCLFHMLNHSAFKGLLFLCAGEILHHAGTVEMTALGGLQKRAPVLGALFALGAASIACLPPFNGFASEFVISLSFIKGLGLTGMEQKIAMLACMACLMLVSGMAAFAYAKAYGMSFLGQPRSSMAASMHAISVRALLPLAIPAAACVACGLASAQVFRAIQPSLSFLPFISQGMESGMGNAASSTAEMLCNISLLGCAAIILSAALAAARKMLLKRRMVASGPTWGCGYQYGTERMQYTPASFVEPAERIFGPLMGTKTDAVIDSAVFPADAHIEVSTADVVSSRFYAPLFEYAEKACNTLKIIQNGSINLYILYILVTLVALLFWGIA